MLKAMIVMMVKKRIKDEDGKLDFELSKKLNHIFDNYKHKGTEKLEKSEILKDAKYYRTPVPHSIKDRPEWTENAIKVMDDCDVVFLDPDNGLIRKQTAYKYKYVLEGEIESYKKHKKSLVLYNSRGRIKEDEYFKYLEGKLGKDIIVLSFHRGTLRDFVFVAASKSHFNIFKKVTKEIMKSDWNKLFSIWLREKE